MCNRRLLCRETATSGTSSSLRDPGRSAQAWTSIVEKEGSKLSHLMQLLKVMVSECMLERDGFPVTRNPQKAFNFDTYVVASP